MFPLPGVSQPLSFLLLLIGAAKRPSVAEKPITVVEEKKPEQSSEACCRCEDRFIADERQYIVSHDLDLIQLLMICS